MCFFARSPTKTTTKRTRPSRQLCRLLGLVRFVVVQNDSSCLFIANKLGQCYNASGCLAGEKQPYMDKSFVYTFPNKRTAHVIQVHLVEELPLAFYELGIEYPRPTLVLIGGADGISSDELAHLHRLFVEVLAPLAETHNMAVVDGGTDAGVMQLIGKAHCEIDANFPLIGVAAIGTVALSEAALDRPRNELLESHHTHFILVPGSTWGDESHWIAEITSVLAGGLPAITILVNGGDIAWNDVVQSVEVNRPVIVVAGSGRTADTLASALHGNVLDNRARELVASGLLRSIDPGQGFDELARTINEFLQ